MQNDSRKSNGKIFQRKGTPDKDSVTHRTPMLSLQENMRGRQKPELSIKHVRS